VVATALGAPQRRPLTIHAAPISIPSVPERGDDDQQRRGDRELARARRAEQARDDDADRRRRGHGDDPQPRGERRAAGQ
jgi:hypothetical protein